MLRHGDFIVNEKRTDFYVYMHIEFIMQHTNALLLFNCTKVNNTYFLPIIRVVEFKFISQSYITSSVSTPPTAGIIIHWFLGVWVLVYIEQGVWLTQSETPRELLKANCEVVENACSHFLSHITTIKTACEVKHNESNLNSWVSIETCN